MLYKPSKENIVSMFVTVTVLLLGYVFLLARGENFFASLILLGILAGLLFALTVVIAKYVHIEFLDDTLIINDPLMLVFNKRISIASIRSVDVKGFVITWCYIYFESNGKIYSVELRLANYSEYTVGEIIKKIISSNSSVKINNRGMALVEKTSSRR